jgi:hypothetical protein
VNDSERRKPSRRLRAFAALALAALAFALRERAAERLPIDYDEPWSLAAAQELAELLRAGELGRLTETNPTPEHPQLAKLVLAAAIARVPESPPSPQRRSVYLNAPGLSESHLLAARSASVVLGTLEVLLLAWLHPLAGLFLAIHTYTVKFTSHAMLEALPALTSLAAVASWARFKATRRSGWWIASAALLGLTAAAKYVYAVAGLAILADWCLELRPAAPGRLARVRPLLLWGAGSLLAFLAATPWFWPDPLARLQGSVLYLTEFSTGSIVREADFPVWQPLAWLTLYIPDDAPAAQPYLVRVDPALTLLACAGLLRTWRRERVFALWLGIALVFLLLWNTKWPHYVLILSAPLCLAAARGAEAVRDAALRVLRGRRRAAA